MPLYQFRRIAEDEIFEEFMSISAREEFLKDPNIEQVVSAPLIVSGVNLKPDEGFRDILRSIKRRNPGAEVNTF